jgi:Fic family protein
MDLSAFTAGREEAQYQYRSFLPEPVHRAWGVSDPDVLMLNSEADRRLGALNAFAQLVPDIDFFIRMYVAKEATQSSRIEGTQTNIEDAFKAQEDLDPDGRDDWIEVQNYIRAVNHAIASLEHLPLSNRLLCETHAILMQGARGQAKRPGEFRLSQNWIGVSLRNAVFIPPHHEHVPYLMSDLERFLHDPGVRLPPLIKIAMAHYQFETIHPFLDGNSRIGRLLIGLYLASEGILVKPALYISDYLERNKTAYVDHLMAVRQGNHLRQWLIFFLHGVSETAQEAIEVFEGILKLKERIERDILPRFGARRQENARELMRLLWQQPVVNIADARVKLATSVNTATSLISDFTRYGVLSEVTGGRRNRLWMFSDYFDLFRRRER